jgi:hypothetical protein
MNYPYRIEQDEKDLVRVQHSHYDEDDQPFLRTARYSLSPDYEFDDVMAKTRVNMQGAMDMQYSMKVWKEHMNS